jgi:hypothetical protein
MEYQASVASSQNKDLCGQCHRKGVTFLRSMAKWSALDWYRCDSCGHIFTRVPPSPLARFERTTRRRDRRLTVQG